MSEYGTMTLTETENRLYRFSPEYLEVLNNPPNGKRIPMLSHGIALVKPIRCGQEFKIITPPVNFPYLEGEGTIKINCLFYPTPGIKM